MEEKFFLIILLFLCIHIHAQLNSAITEKLIQAGEAEPLNFNFSLFNNASDFIRKFNLSEHEIAMVGYWTDIYLIKNMQTGKNVRILGLYFFPNRIMEIDIEVIKETTRCKGYIYLTWQVDNNNLFAQPLFYLLKTNETILKSHFFQCNNFIKFGVINEFEKAYVLSNQLDFAPINQYLRNEWFVFGKDNFRYRILREEAFPSIFHRLQNDEKIKNFLLTPNSNDSQYFIELEKTTMWTYTPSYTVK